MASITIRNLDEHVKTRLRVRAAQHNRSMEEEVRIILREAVSDGRSSPRDLAQSTRVCFAPLGGVELEPPPRSPMREPPASPEADLVRCVLDTYVVGKGNPLS